MFSLCFLGLYSKQTVFSRKINRRRWRISHLKSYSLVFTDTLHFLQIFGYPPNRAFRRNRNKKQQNKKKGKKTGRESRTTCFWEFRREDIQGNSYLSLALAWVSTLPWLCSGNVQYSHPATQKKLFTSKTQAKFREEENQICKANYNWFSQPSWHVLARNDTTKRSYFPIFPCSRNLKSH